ncbi:unnamed protein product, partial [Ectocarpus sp. 4 AP-2014]
SELLPRGVELLVSGHRAIGTTLARFLPLLLLLLFRAAPSCHVSCYHHARRRTRRRLLRRRPAAAGAAAAAAAAAEPKHKRVVLRDESDLAPQGLLRGEPVLRRVPQA